MIPHKPQVEPENTQEMAPASPGWHQMKLNRVKEGVESPKWKGDVWEFAGNGMTISEFVDDRTTWKYSRLAKAIGGKALEVYRQTDSFGHSLFDPCHYLGSEVSIQVEECVRNGQPSTRIKKIDPVERPTVWDKQDVPASPFENNSPPDDDPNHGEGATSKPIKDDDIPF